jgi:diacylglycerol kinase family enzyme
MAREFKPGQKLTKDDIVYLRQRYPEGYIARLIELGGSTKGAEKAVSGPIEPAGDGSSVTVLDGPETGGESAEDLIGDPSDAPPVEPVTVAGGDGTLQVFDVIGATESEVREWSAQATPEAKATALAAEQAREDRDPRKGVVSLLS